jgi:hypothetical protein
MATVDSFFVDVQTEIMHFFCLWVFAFVTMLSTSQLMAGPLTGFKYPLHSFVKP